MKLYDAVWAPSPRRVRIYLAEKGIEVEREVIDLRADQQLAPEYLKVNPRGVVPALVLDDGEVITESGAICRYFEAAQPEPPLFGKTPVEIARIESWVRRIEHEGYDGVVKVLRNTIPAMRDRGLPGKWPVIPQIPELIDRGTIMWTACIESLNAQLAESEWIAGDAFSFADITALVTIDFARAAKLAVPEACEGVARWYQAASARPSAGA
jgi:glutathione S-transferase